MIILCAYLLSLPMRPHPLNLRRRRVTAHRQSSATVVLLVILLVIFFGTVELRYRQDLGDDLAWESPRALELRFHRPRLRLLLAAVEEDRRAILRAHVGPLP